MINQLSNALEIVGENIIVMDDQVENVVRIQLRDFGRDGIALTAVLRENAHPAIQRRANQESVITVLGDEAQNTPNGFRIFSLHENRLIERAHAEFLLIYPPDSTSFLRH